MSLDGDLEARLKHIGYLDDTINRANGSLIQFHSASAKNPNWLNESHIRAGLADFRSIAACLTREYRAVGLKGKPAPMSESQNPLIHLMVLLRNVNLHARASRTATQKTTVISNLGGEPHEYTYEAVVPEAFDAPELLDPWATDYDRADIERVLSWLFEKQLVFGVADVFHKGVEAYCHEILACCAEPRAPCAARKSAARA